MSKITLIANFKSNKNTALLEQWFEQIGSDIEQLELVVAPSYPYLEKARLMQKGWRLAAQNVSPFPMGSYTGEVNAMQLRDLGVEYCVVGHSERRQYFGETSAQVAQKITQLLSAQITPILCLDEPYLEEQFYSLSDSNLSKTHLIIAYEPISAIGSGQPASVGRVQTVAEKIKNLYGDNHSVIYGGSVDERNIGELLLVCDGALIASASQEARQMNSIIAVAQKSMLNVS